MSAAVVTERFPVPPAGPDRWRHQPAVGAGTPPPPAEPPVEPPTGGGSGPLPHREPGRRRPATAAAAAGTLLLVVAVLSVIWPALAILVLAGAGATLLVRGGLRWARQAWHGPRRAGLHHRVLPGALAACAFAAAAGVLVAPAAAAWTLGMLMGLLLAAACGLALAAAVRGGRRRFLWGVGGAVGLAVAMVMVVVPAAAVAVAVATMVGLLWLSGWAMLAAARTMRRTTVPG